MYKHLRSVTSALQLGFRQALEGGGVPSEFRGIALSWLCPSAPWGSRAAWNSSQSCL